MRFRSTHSSKKTGMGIGSGGRVPRFMARTSMNIYLASVLLAYAGVMRALIALASKLVDRL
jgi:hypothetical protein